MAMPPPRADGETTRRTGAAEWLRVRPAPDCSCRVPNASCRELANESTVVVIPAKAGIHCSNVGTANVFDDQCRGHWIPACAGMTEGGGNGGDTLSPATLSHA